LFVAAFISFGRPVMTLINISNEESQATLSRINSELKQMGAGKIVSLSELHFVVSALKVIISDGESVSSEERLPTFPPGTIGLLIPNTYYHINVKRASLYAASILAGLFTSGIATSLVAAHGGLKTALAILNRENGEFCNFVQATELQKAGVEIVAQAVSEKIAKKECPFKQIGCRYLTSGNCSIATSNVENNIASLQEKGALEMRESRLIVPR
jgi:hypothetical protein